VGAVALPPPPPRPLDDVAVHRLQKVPAFLFSRFPLSVTS
jgi:hypothetical protein